MELPQDITSYILPQYLTFEDFYNFRTLNREYYQLYLNVVDENIQLAVDDPNIARELYDVALRNDDLHLFQRLLERILPPGSLFDDFIRLMPEKIIIYVLSSNNNLPRNLVYSGSGVRGPRFMQ